MVLSHCQRPRRIPKTSTKITMGICVAIRFCRVCEQLYTILCNPFLSVSVTGSVKTSLISRDTEIKLKTPKFIKELDDKVNFKLKVSNHEFITCSFEKTCVQFIFWFHHRKDEQDASTSPFLWATPLISFT